MSAPWPPSADSAPVEPRAEGAGVASGKPPNSSVLAGREHELARIDALLGEASAGRSGALLVVGEPGMGKTTLLEAARRRAGSFTCLGARGVEAESHLAYAGLFGVLNPIRDRIADIPDSQATALGSALAWSSGAATADPFLLGAATLSLLAAAAEYRPVLVIVDDLQWLDSESAGAIAFAARRLGPDAVAFLLAAREGAVPAQLSGGLPVMPVPGLSASAAATLLPTRAAPRSWTAWSSRRRATPSPSWRWRPGWTMRSGSAPPSSPTRCLPETGCASTSGPRSPGCPPQLAPPCCTWPWSVTRLGRARRRHGAGRCGRRRRRGAAGGLSARRPRRAASQLPLPASAATQQRPRAGGSSRAARRSCGACSGLARE